MNSQNRYEIKVYGQLDDPWLDWFGITRIQIEILAHNNQVTIFSDVVKDQAGLVSRDPLPCPPLHSLALPARVTVCAEQVLGSRPFHEA